MKKYQFSALIILMALCIQPVFNQDDIYHMPSLDHKQSSGSINNIDTPRASNQVENSTSNQNYSYNQNYSKYENMSSYEKYRAQKEAEYFASTDSINDSTKVSDPRQQVWDQYKEKNMDNSNLSSESSNNDPVYSNQDVYIQNNYYTDGYAYDDYDYRFRTFYRPYYYSYWDAYDAFSWYGPSLYLGYSWYSPYYYHSYWYSPYYYSGYYNCWHCSGWNYYTPIYYHSQRYPNQEGRRRMYAGFSTPQNYDKINSSQNNRRRVENSNGTFGTTSSYPSNPDRRRSVYINQVNSNNSQSQPTNRRMATGQEYQDQSKNYSVPEYNDNNRRRSTEQPGIKQNSEKSEENYTPVYSRPSNDQRRNYNNQNENTQRRRVSSESAPSNRSSESSGESRRGYSSTPNNNSNSGESGGSRSNGGNSRRR